MRPSPYKVRDPMATSLTARLRVTTAIILLVLLVQFILGMVVNLFVDIPKNHPGARPSEYFSGAAQSVAWAVTGGPFWLVVHAGLGLLLLLAAIAALTMAIASRRRAWIVTGGIGLIGVLAAGFNGASFLNYNQDFSSMLMSAAFAIAVASYVLGLLMGGWPGESAHARPARGADHALDGEPVGARSRAT